MADRERQPRLEEEEVVDQGGEGGGGDRRPEAEGHGAAQHAHQEDHREVGAAVELVDLVGDQPGERDQAPRGGVSAPLAEGGGQGELGPQGGFSLALLGDDVQGRAAELLDDRRDQRAAEQSPPARAVRAADHHLGDVVASDVLQERAHQVVAGEHQAGAAELFGELERGADPRCAGRVRRGLVGPLEVGDGPGRVHHHVGEPPPGPHQALGHGVGGDEDQDALARRPRALDAPLAHVDQQLVVHRLCHAPEGKLAQGGEVLRLEEVGRRELGGVRQIDLALGQALAKLVRGDVHQLDVVGARERRVRHRLALAHAGDLPDHVHQALQVLDVEGRPDVDPGGKQFFDVLPALRVARAGGVGVGVFIDQQQRRSARQRRVDVEFEQMAALVLDGLAGQHLQPVQQRLGLAPAVGLHDPDQHRASLLAPARGLRQHFVGLAYPRRHAEEDLEPAATRLRRFRQKGVRIGPAGLVGIHASLGFTLGKAASRARLVISTLTVGWPINPSAGPWTCSAMTLRT